MAQPGMTPGVRAADAPEAANPALDPGRNVGASQFAHQPVPGEVPPQGVLDDAQAEARRETSPPSYKKPETVEARKPMPGLLLIGGAVAIIVACLWIFLG
jgi:hypothetical protein